MPTRELKHPEFTVDLHDEGLLLRLVIPGSKFGPIKVVLSLNEATELAASLDQASIYAASEGER